MIIEYFHPGQMKKLYQRFDEKGRMLPEGVQYINSWINEDITICYQIMEASSADALRTWISNWNDIVDFKLIPVISSAEARKRVMGFSARPGSCTAATTTEMNEEGRSHDSDIV